MSKGLKFVMRDPKKDHIVQWQVKWQMPDADGELVEVGFKGHFKILPSDEVEALFGGGVFGRFANNAKNREGLEKVLVNWSGVMDPDGGGEAPFSDERLKQVLNYEDAVTACIRAYIDCLQGHHEKN